MSTVNVKDTKPIVDVEEEKKKPTRPLTGIDKYLHGISLFLFIVLRRWISPLKIVCGIT